MHKHVVYINRNIFLDPNREFEKRDRSVIISRSFFLHLSLKTTSALLTDYSERLVLNSKVHIGKTNNFISDFIAVYGWTKSPFYERTACRIFSCANKNRNQFEQYYRPQIFIPICYNSPGKLTRQAKLFHHTKCNTFH